MANDCMFWLLQEQSTSKFKQVAKGRIAGGGFMADGSTVDSGGRQTASVIITCVMAAASGGLIFWLRHGDFRWCHGHGVISKDLLSQMADAKQDEYCMFDSQVLTAFTSSLYIAGLASSLVSGRLTKAVGCQGVSHVAWWSHLPHRCGHRCRCREY